MDTKELHDKIAEVVKQLPQGAERLQREAKHILAVIRDDAARILNVPAIVGVWMKEVEDVIDAEKKAHQS